MANTSTACVDKGRMCGMRIFMRSAGIRHSAALRSNSPQRAAINSPVRKKVKAINCIAKRVCGVPW